MAIQPARLLSRSQHLLPGQFHVSEVFFEVPMDYSSPAKGTLKLFGRVVNNTERPAGAVGFVHPELVCEKPFLVYLEGGPGFGVPRDLPLTRHFLDRGYQMLYLDYRGTGLSTPINARHVTQLGDAAAQADYLKLFRQDNIVRDLEAVRLCLTADLPADHRKWSIVGQSFGGFVSLTYLSKYPESLRESFIAGGLAPVGKTPDEVYEATYQKVIERNRAYYNKFPDDVEKVGHIVSHIADSGGGIPLPGGGVLTPGRFLSIGIDLGMHGGIDNVHAQVVKMAADLDQFGFFTRSTLVAFEQRSPAFDVAPIYAVLHEAIYCEKPGVASNWAAARVGSKLKEFAWVLEPSNAAQKLEIPPAGEPIFFTGEMVFPFHFDTYPELMGLKDAADLLAKYDQWEELYDEDKLRKNEHRVPVYAISYIEDMYVAFDLAEETARKVKGSKVIATNDLYHNALKAESSRTLAALCRLRDDTID